MWSSHCHTAGSLSYTSNASGPPSGLPAPTLVLHSKLLSFFFSPPRFLAPGPTTFVSFTRIRVQCPKSVAPLPDFLLFRGITFVVLCISMKHYNFPWVCCLRCPNREPIPCSRLALPPSPALLPSLSLQSQVVSCSHISVPRFFPLRTVSDRS